MGQASVRAAITQTIEAAALPLVGAVYPSRAYIGEEDYELNASQQYVTNSNGSSCVIVVTLPGPDKRMRRTLTGRGGVDDTNIHPVALEVFFASTNGDPIAAQADYDTIIDSLVILVRGNPTMSAPASVWSAGEYEAGVVHEQTDPFTRDDGMTVFIVGVVRFEAWEWVAGTAGAV